MRTTLDVDEKLLEQVVKFTGEKNKSKAVSNALKLYLQWKATQELRAMAGKIEFVDNFEEILKEQNKLDIERLKRAHL